MNPKNPKRAAEYQRDNYGVRPYQYFGVLYHGGQVIIIIIIK
jgi:hypothetical protein